MIINPTKKSQALFNQLPQVADKKIGQLYSQQNPFFSWHANYINLNRKKVLLLVNDLTYVPLVLADINAKNKKRSAELIPQAIREVFSGFGISKKKIDEYLELAGEIEVNGGFDRTITGVATNFLQAGLPVDLQKIIQL